MIMDILSCALTPDLLDCGVICPCCCSGVSIDWLLTVRTEDNIDNSYVCTYIVSPKRDYTHRIVCLIAGHLLPEMVSDLLSKMFLKKPHFCLKIDLVYIL